MNQPDLVLFVGEALVGNEAVDQLVKFNQALADHSNMTNPRLIDGIILTKFDTIDDKVKYMSRLVGKPTMWFPTRSDTNRPVQSQKRARSLKFRI